MPYSIASGIWQGSTLLLYLFVIGTIVEAGAIAMTTLYHGWYLIALAFPAVLNVQIPPPGHPCPAIPSARRNPEAA